MALYPRVCVCVYVSNSVQGQPCASRLLYSVMMRFCWLIDGKSELLFSANVILPRQHLIRVVWNLQTKCYVQKKLNHAECSYDIKVLPNNYRAATDGSELCELVSEKTKVL